MPTANKQTLALVILAILLCLAGSGFSQNAVKDAQGNYRAVKINKDSAEAKETGNWYIDYAGDKLPVFQSTKGRLFVRKISKKSGKSYNFYLKLTSNG